MSFSEALEKLAAWGIITNSAQLSRFWRRGCLLNPKDRNPNIHALRPGKLLLAFKLRTGKSGGFVLKVKSHRGFQICPKPPSPMAARKIQGSAIVFRHKLPQADQERIAFLESRMAEIALAKNPYQGAIAAARAYPRFSFQSYQRFYEAWARSGRHWAVLLNKSRYPSLWYR